MSYLLQHGMPHSEDNQTDWSLQLTPDRRLSYRLECSLLSAQPHWLHLILLSRYRQPEYSRPGEQQRYHLFWPARLEQSFLFRWWLKLPALVQASSDSLTHRSSFLLSELRASFRLWSVSKSSLLTQNRTRPYSASHRPYRRAAVHRSLKTVRLHSRQTMPLNQVQPVYPCLVRDATGS